MQHLEEEQRCQLWAGLTRFLFQSRTQAVTAMALLDEKEREDMAELLRSLAPSEAPEGADGQEGAEA